MHVPCSSKRMGLEKIFREVAEQCAEWGIDSRIPCCGMAGDRYTSPLHNTTHSQLTTHSHYTQHTPQSITTIFPTHRSVLSGVDGSALNTLSREDRIPADCKDGVSSRTCEIGLSLHSGKLNYHSIFYLVDECTERVWCRLLWLQYFNRHCYIQWHFSLTKSLLFASP